MKLVMDLVVNHTSDEHHWFQESRKSEDNPYRDYYFWKKEKPSVWPSFFGGEVWEYDEPSDSYYLHLFSKKQPDLNWENPVVRQEVYKLMRFWLDKGVDGFRMDVIPFISKRLDFPELEIEHFGQIVEDIYANGPRLHEFLQEMNREVCQHYDIVTIGEAPGVTPELANLYVGEDRNELNMIFHFGHMFIDMGPEGKFDPHPYSLQDFKEVFSTWHRALGERGWVSIFLDNHDFARMVSRWGNDGEYREKSAKLLATLILSLRGTPSIYQGTELGMTNVTFPSIDDYRDIETLNLWKAAAERGDDLEVLLKGIHRQGRDNVRTPMQWDDSRNAGFTEAPEPWIKVNPNYSSINAEESLADKQSIFYYYQNLLVYRKHNKTLVYGDYQPLVFEDESVYAYRRWDERHTYWVLLNFSDEASLPLDSLITEPNQWTYELGNYAVPKDLSTPLRAWEARILKKISLD
jgi:oligo-1,6-glucosidase